MADTKTSMLTGVGIAATLPAAASAQDIIYTELGPVDGDLSFSGLINADLLDIDLDGDSFVDYRFGTEGSTVGAGSSKLFIAGAPGAGEDNTTDFVVGEGTQLPTPLAAGDIVGPTLPSGQFYVLAGNRNGDGGDTNESDIWRSNGSALFPVDGVERFIGIQTEIVVDGNARTVFGWIGVQLNSASGAAATATVDGFVTGHAININGDPIIVGDTGITTDPCPPDQDVNGVLDIDDFSQFVQNFFAGDSVADVNSDGMLDIDDFSDFVGFFFNSSQFPGCPS